MAIGGDYAQPVQVNGYLCRNCADVDLAKKYVDPARPEAGPFGIDAPEASRRSEAVRFGGALANIGPSAMAADRPLTATDPFRPGATLDISA